MTEARISNRLRVLNGLPKAVVSGSQRPWYTDAKVWATFGAVAVMVVASLFLAQWRHWVLARPVAWVPIVVVGVALPFFLNFTRAGRWVRDKPVFWLALILLPLYFAGLYSEYWMMHPDVVFEDGSRSLGISNEAIRKGAFYAVWTALAYSVLFIWLDRFRASQPMVWLLVFGWGAAASTWFSLHVNTWMGQAMATREANADSGARAAVFSAPFVEEFAKATVLILLVILWRNRIVSRLSIIALAGLSAIGFAFVENILYYSRVWMQATNDITIANPDETMLELVMLRGVYTSFGHPLFTIMTGAGLAIGLGARSKIVRVLAPVGGFMLACFGHMLFNGLSSTNPIEALMMPWYMALALVGVITISLIVSVAGNGQIIRARLTDYQRAGWIGPREVELFGGPLRRARLLFWSIFRGPKKWWHTAKLVRRYTELAYLRDKMTRGTVGAPGDDRAHDILHEIETLRPKALTDYTGLPLLPPRRKKRAYPSELLPGESPGPLTSHYPAPTAPGPAGVGGNWPAPR
ncbi:Membrane proteinase PrsW, cleaves anti-sigma factor RsiW, M82 family [Tessaracoccus bendigoensis DSM 12906]|uniref:Membrane proteinase PrsW, cleaves anti-sigma factor RsiW, M82 family n=1 Tax=Tessaracoccus bendigoensis DSM 12906 TaxID=1123357 RepID=A0A1M6DDI5_9ACTN|nr:PrsW family intramembrane metalloprotease [Tessaracoccus bendigoensis]SHI71272.1 Membrane proteinase PrsW, cleaves anti-sigma factor RsiW, M82 family [Tessaracoccus bendigoensis DSM 12906]